MIDYHIHTCFSDGADTHEDCVRKAIKMGLAEIGFSDHICLNNPKWSVDKNDYQLMIETILSFQNSDELPLKVRFGLEVDYLPGKEKEIKEVLEQFPVDYLIGSVHYIKGWNFDTINKGYNKQDINKLYSDYFKLIQNAAMSGLFDIIGHADVIKKFNYYPSINLDNLYRETATIFKKSNVVVELNTSGLSKPCKEFYPSNDFLKYCFFNDVPVTLGSDAHQSNDISKNFSLATEKLKETGYRKIAVFEKRKRSFINL